MATPDTVPTTDRARTRFASVRWVDAALVAVMLVALVPVGWLAGLVITAPESAALTPARPSSSSSVEQVPAEHSMQLQTDRERLDRSLTSSRV